MTQAGYGCGSEKHACVQNPKAQQQDDALIRTAAV